MVYCRTLPDLTFPVTEWDLGTRLDSYSGFGSTRENQGETVSIRFKVSEDLEEHHYQCRVMSLHILGLR